MPRVDLDGSSSVVTGGASGIGEASARQLAAAGSRVVVADLEGPNRFQAQFQDGSLAPGNLVTFFEDYQAREEVSWR